MKSINLPNFFVGIMVGLLISVPLNYLHKVEKEETKKTIIVPDSTLVTYSQWKSIEGEDLGYDMKEVGVTLIKRSFNDNGEEGTYIETTKGNNTQARYFHCSREVHRRLVKEFNEMLEKRKTEY